jgi:hypothetical protein
MVTNLYRNISLIQMETHETDAVHADELVEQVRLKWAFLRDRGLAGDYPIEILRSRGATDNGNSKVKIVEVFRWASQQSQRDAAGDSRYQEIMGRLGTLGTGSQECYSEAVRGFNKNFPGVGGMELLKGVCSCLLSIDGIVKDFPMSVKNGIVLMHRSPRMDFDQDGKNEMYLNIVMHGGEMVQAALGPIRVEQNFSRPNDGIVKSNGGPDDFPATAIWRVSWRIRTVLGPVLTDPDQPLIFGPATVNHYPPVGTHFHSSTGPVKLVLEETGRQVGTLVPGELTAFDIIVTKDDEIFADHLNAPPADLVDALQGYIDRPIPQRVREEAAVG